MHRKLIALVSAASCLAWSAGAGARTPQEEENLRLAIEFYDAALNHKDWEKAQTYMGPRYDQHSVYMPDQHEGLRILVDRIIRDHPDNRGQVMRAVVKGDMVILHMHVTRHRGHPGWSVFEMIRMEDGKAVEHWDMFRALEKVEEAEVIF